MNLQQPEHADEESDDREGRHRQDRMVATMSSSSRRFGKGDAFAKSAGFSLVSAGRASISPALGKDRSSPVVSDNDLMELESGFTSS